jgi:hypothetical protein
MLQALAAADLTDVQCLSVVATVGKLAPADQLNAASMMLQLSRTASCRLAAVSVVVPRAAAALWPQAGQAATDSLIDAIFPFLATAAEASAALHVLTTAPAGAVNGIQLAVATIKTNVTAALRENNQC